MIEMRCTWSGRWDSHGFKILNLDLVNDGRRVDRKTCYSGFMNRQQEDFVHPRNDYAGSGRPIPEGIYTIGNVYRGQFGAGIGNIWIPVEVIDEYRVNNRSAFGLHDDANRWSARGSAGCLVFYRRSDLEHIVAWLGQQAAPERLVVNWKQGLLKQLNYKPHKPTAPTCIRPSRISNNGIELIKHFEGLKLEAYRDPVGVWTIGYGHTTGVRSGQRITQAQAEAFLMEDLASFETAVRRQIEIPVTQPQFDALVSFAFNCGASGFQASTLLKKLNENDIQGAADQFLRWNKGKVNGTLVELPGLTRRRKSERHLFITGDLKFEFA